MTLKEFQRMQYADAVARTVSPMAGLRALDSIHTGRIDRDMQHRRAAMLKLTPITNQKGH